MFFRDLIKIFSVYVQIYIYKGQTSDLKKRIERHNTSESEYMRYTYKKKGKRQGAWMDKKEILK